MPRHPSAREAAKAATREALLEAALAEIAEHGLDAPSLDAICARAGYTRGAFYVHFRDREALLAAVVQHAMRRFLDAMIVQDDGAHDLEESITRFAAVVSALRDRPAGRRTPAPPFPTAVPFARVLDAVSRAPRLREGFSSMLAAAVTRLGATVADAQKAGTIRRDTDADLLATLLVALALGLLAGMDVGLQVDPVAGRTALIRLLAAR